MSPRHFTRATIVLLFASEQAHCTLVVCDWMSDCSFTQHIFNIHWCGYNSAIVDMAGATSNCCHLGTRSVYTIQPCTGLPCHLIWNQIFRVFSCNLPPAPSVEWLGSVVTQGWKGTVVRVAGEIILPLRLSGLKPKTLHTGLHLCELTLSYEGIIVLTFFPILKLFEASCWLVCTVAHIVILCNSQKDMCERKP